MVLAFHPTTTGICCAWHSASGTVNYPQSYCICGYYKWAFFYVNITKIEEDYLFPHDPVQVPILFVSWINLDFGINTFFAPGLTGYSHDATVPKSNRFSCSGSRRSNSNNGGSDKGLCIEEMSLFYHVVGELLTNVKFSYNVK